MLNYGCVCPVQATLSLIGGKWKWLVYRELYLHDVRRFGELKRGIPAVSAKVLAETLKEMEADGLICRTAFAEVPVRVEYRLTEAGRSLEKVFLAMVEWGTGFLAGKHGFPPPPAAGN